MPSTPPPLELRKAGGIRSGEVRRGLKAQLKQANAELAHLRALIATYTVPEPQEQPQVPRDTELARVRERLDKLDELMSSATTDREWDNLSRAYERMFRAWTYLANIPGPGNMRPESPKKDRRSPTAGPLLELRPAPPTTGSVPPADNQAQ